MESLGSHGVVIVLLLVVVAAALLTGQGEEDATAKSLSTQSELLDFDELNVDLPLPTHSGDVTLAESQTPVAPVPSFSSASEAAVVATVTDTMEPAVQTQSPVAAVEEAPMVPAVAPVATLEAPQSGTSTGLDHEFNQGFLSNGVKTNEFVSPSTGLNAMTAANRVASGEADSALPSLEELAGLQEQSVPAAASTSAAPSSAAPARLLSKTPVGIPDWSIYLPALDSAVEPDAGTSSFPNQVFQP